MPAPVFLAVELDRHQGRVVAGEYSARRILRHEVHRFPVPAVKLAGTLRRDLLGLWQHVQFALAEAGQRFGRRIISIGVHGACREYGLLSSRNELGGIPFAAQDSRTRGMVDHAATRLSRQKLYAMTGLQPDREQLLFHLIASRLQDDPQFSVVGRVLPLPDLVHWMLCGSQVVEFTGAAATQCLDLRRRGWGEEILRRFEIPVALFPEIVPAGTNLGPLRAEVAADAGIPRVNVVSPATHSLASASAVVLSDSKNKAGSAGLVFQDGEALVFVESAQSVVGEDARLAGVSHVGGLDGSWLLFKPLELWRHWSAVRAGSPDGTAVSARAIRKAPALKTLFHPQRLPAEQPYELLSDRLRVRCAETGQLVPADPAALHRALLESLVLEVRAILQRLEKLTGRQLDGIHLEDPEEAVPDGNDFARWLADGCGRSVTVGPPSAAVLGNLLVQARAAGKVQQLAELRRVVRNSCEPVTIAPTNGERWEEGWTRYRRLVSEPG